MGVACSSDKKTGGELQQSKHERFIALINLIDYFGVQADVLNRLVVIKSKLQIQPDKDLLKQAARLILSIVDLPKFQTCYPILSQSLSSLALEIIGLDDYTTTCSTRKILY